MRRSCANGAEASVRDFVRPLPATIFLKLPSCFNDWINSIARTTHSAYCPFPCVEGSHRTFMRRLSDSPETVSPIATNLWPQLADVLARLPDLSAPSASTSILRPLRVLRSARPSIARVREVVCALIGVEGAKQRADSRPNSGINKPRPFEWRPCARAL